MNKNVRQTVLPIITALIWGTSFVVQDIGAALVGPLTFNFARCATAVVFLSLIAAVGSAIDKKRAVVKPPLDKKALLLGGVQCGLCLFASMFLQQLGITMGTRGGKAAFITSTYMIFVPIIGIFLKRKAGVFVWIAAFVSLFGLYFLCINESFSVQSSDLLVLACAASFAVHILSIDRYSSVVDPILLCLVQFTVAAVLSFGCSLIFEWGEMQNLKRCLLPVIYIGVFSSGVAYTLQIIAQKGTNPTIVSVLLSLESLFAVIMQAITFKVGMTVREYIGCALILFAVLLTQVKFKKGGMTRRQ